MISLGVDTLSGDTEAAPLGTPVYTLVSPFFQASFAWSWAITRLSAPDSERCSCHVSSSRCKSSLQLGPRSRSQEGGYLLAGGQAALAVVELLAAAAGGGGGGPSG